MGYNQRLYRRALEKMEKLIKNEEMGQILHIGSEVVLDKIQKMDEGLNYTLSGTTIGSMMRYYPPVFAVNTFFKICRPFYKTLGHKETEIGLKKKIWTDDNIDQGYNSSAEDFADSDDIDELDDSETEGSYNLEDSMKMESTEDAEDLDSTELKIHLISNFITK